MEILLQAFVAIWLILGSIILALMYLNQTSRKKIYFYISTFLVLITISYSIYRENIISFRPVLGYPTEKVRFISYNITLEGDKKIIGLWAVKLSDKKDVLYKFEYTDDIEKTLREAKKQQKGGSSTLLSMVEQPKIKGVDSGAKMVGEIELVDKLPDKFSEPIE